ncbi:MAG: type 4a pilus biogenesis protein PilO [bacterium]|nr:type 4a pilus biogenesis protein PilO [bacterium]
MIKIIISIVSLAIAGGVFFIYTESAYSNTQLLQTNIDRHNQALDKAAELKKLQETLLSRFNAFNKDEVDRLHKLLPDHVDNVRLILDLDHLASTFGMALQNVVISSPASESAGTTVIGSIGAGKEKYDSLTLRFSTHGTYANFVAFMESLESSLRIVDLVALSLSPEAPGSAAKGTNTPAAASESSYKYDITVRTYWLR